jgi:hypothetical protein
LFEINAAISGLATGDDEAISTFKI